MTLFTTRLAHFRTIGSAPTARSGAPRSTRKQARLAPLRILRERVKIEPPVFGRTVSRDEREAAGCDRRQGLSRTPRARPASAINMPRPGWKTRAMVFDA